MAGEPAANWKVTHLFVSMATFGSLAFLLYDETRDEKYLKVAQGALDWMTRQDFRRVGPTTFQQAPASVMYHIFEFYATALPYLRPATPQCHNPFHNMVHHD